MIRVTVEVITDKGFDIVSETGIINDCSGSIYRGNYRVDSYEKDQIGRYRFCKFKINSHKRDSWPLELVRKAINKAIREMEKANEGD